MMTLARKWNEAVAEIAVLPSLSLRTPGELIGMRFDDSDNYLGDRILAAGQPCTKLGPGGIGKSRLSLQLGVCMITGRNFLGIQTRAKHKRWLFVQTENSNRRLRYDLNNIISAFGLTPEEVAGLDQHLFIHTLETDNDFFLNVLNTETYAAVQRLIQEVQPEFVVWDPLNSFTNNDLNSDMDMRAVIAAISALTRAGNPNRVPILLHHSLTGKIGAARAVGWDRASYGRNSKVLHAWTRTQINLAPRSADNPNLLIMSCGKNNNGAFFADIGIRFDEQLGIYVNDESFDPEEFREEVGIGHPKRRTVTVEDVASLCEDAIPKPKLVERIKAEFGIQQRAAYDAVSRAEAAERIAKDKNQKWPSTYSVVRPERTEYDDQS
jgi:AAA domain